MDPADSFRQRWPWIGPDLQTLRDVLRPPAAAADSSASLRVPLPDGGALLVRSEAPVARDQRGWVLLVHGLGGDSQRPGVRRLAACLLAAGFGVWRVNLRGAGAGRPLAAGSYAAACTADLEPLLRQARQWSGKRPLLAVGLSLGGTVLLNAVLDRAQLDRAAGLDGLVCVSSPLDLDGCVRRIGSWRNRLYQRVLLAGLRRQVLADPGLPLGQALALLRGVATIRDFDAAITAPRWGYADGPTYYRQASPLARLRAGLRLPPTLVLQALDDPWVPAEAAIALAAEPPPGLELCLPQHGGHNGFHGRGDGRGGSWADHRVTAWLLEQGRRQAGPS